MTSIQTPEWRSNLRANLILWPEASDNIAGLASCAGHPYSEERFVAESNIANTRAVRQTAEIMALLGLAYRDESGDVFRLTDLGLCALSFLGHGAERRANENNLPVLGDLVAGGMAAVIEYRIVWALMRQTGDVLSNEELNRAMARIGHASDVRAVAASVLEAREVEDPTLIGERLYKEEEYADEATRSDQRKAMNPIFLLAGAGGILMSMNGDDGYRRIRPWAAAVIDASLASIPPVMNWSSDAEAALEMARYASPPALVRQL